MANTKIQSEIKKIQKILKQLVTRHLPKMVRDLKKAPRNQQWDVILDHLTEMKNQLEQGVKPSLNKILRDLKVPLKSLSDKKNLSRRKSRVSSRTSTTKKAKPKPQPQEVEDQTDFGNSDQ